jgi:hypothetical protein
MHRAELLDLEPLQIKSFLKDLFPPEAKARDSNLQQRRPNIVFKHTV